MIMFFSRENLKLKVKSNFYNVNNNVKTNILFFLGKRYSFDIKFYFIIKNIFGLNIKRLVKFFIHHYGFGFHIKFNCLDIQLMNYIQNVLKRLFLHYELQKYIYNNVKRKKKLNLYMGIRAMLRLPGRGQRTKTNAGTLKQFRTEKMIVKVGRKKDFRKIKNKKRKAIIPTRFYKFKNQRTKRYKNFLKKNFYKFSKRRR